MCVHRNLPSTSGSVRPKTFCVCFLLFRSYEIQDEKGRYMAKIFKCKTAFDREVRVFKNSNKFLFDK